MIKTSQGSVERLTENQWKSMQGRQIDGIRQKKSPVSCRASNIIQKIYTLQPIKRYT